LPEICFEPIPLLIPYVDKTIELSQLKIACLLANAFLCTFPEQGGSQIISEEIEKIISNFESLLNKEEIEIEQKTQVPKTPPNSLATLTQEQTQIEDEKLKHNTPKTPPNTLATQTQEQTPIEEKKRREKRRKNNEKGQKEKIQISQH